MSQHTGTGAAAQTALADLIHTARIHRDLALMDGDRRQTRAWEDLRDHLDRVRTTLVQEGDDYLPEAWGMVDAGRLTIARNLARLARRPGEAYRGGHETPPDLA